MSTEEYGYDGDGGEHTDRPAPASCSEATPNQHIYTEADAEIVVFKWLKQAGGKNGNRTITRKSSGIWFADDDWLGINLWGRTIEELAANLGPRNSSFNEPSSRVSEKHEPSS